jgi:pimeloyl-ACP methyl ester carboxylesterase
MASQLPRGHFAEVPDAGHLAPLEQPEFVNAQIMQFMS